MAEPYEIRVADFSDTPFGRYRKDGPESGEVFRQDLLIPALEAHQKVLLNIDNVEGLPSSFWEEIMGGLIRKGYSLGSLRDRLTVETSQPELETYVRLGWRYAKEESDKSVN